MKIATYNIWNSEQGMPARKDHIIREIQKINAEVLCLQEVSHKAQAVDIAVGSGYDHLFFDHYPNEDEGLCLLSHYPFAYSGSWMAHIHAIFGVVVHSGRKIGVINLHLPWDSEREREKQIAEIVKRAEALRADFIYLAGDFNCSENSDVYRFLTGEGRLAGEEINPHWCDLASLCAQRDGIEAGCTLDFRKNPRFIGHTTEENIRVDRILFRQSDRNEIPAIHGCTVFGKTVYEETGLSASDHYGVAIEVEEKRDCKAK